MTTPISDLVGFLTADMGDYNALGSWKYLILLLFHDTVIDGTTDPNRPGGWLMACVAAQSSGQSPKVRNAYAAGLAANADAVAARLARAVEDGDLPACFPVRRARLLVDLMQAIALRARSGAEREALRAHAPLCGSRACLNA